MRIFVLDDQQVRHDLIKKFLGKGNSITHAYNCDEAMQALSRETTPFDIAFLDHDLEDFIHEEDGGKIERHGVYFVRYMLATIPKEKLPVSFIIHSYNDAGANSMHFLLQENGLTSTKWKFGGDMLKAIAERL